MDAVMCDILKNDNVLREFCNSLTKMDRIKILINAHNMNIIDMKKFIDNIKHINIFNLDELFKNGIIKYIIDIKKYEEYLPIFLDAYGCDVEYNYYDEENYVCDCERADNDDFYEKYAIVFNNIDYFKPYLNYIITNKKNRKKNIKSFVETFYEMVKFLNKDICDYVFDTFEKDKALLKVFIQAANNINGFIERCCDNNMYMLKKAFIYNYKIQDIEEFYDDNYQFTDYDFMAKECFRNMTNKSTIKLSKLVSLYLKMKNKNDRNPFIKLIIKTSIRLNRITYVQKKIHSTKNNNIIHLGSRLTNKKILL